MSLCKFIGVCKDIEMIGQENKGTLRDSQIGINESHQELCTTPLQDYCDLKQRYLFNYSINPFQNKTVMGQA
ncbi:MAG: hypothetical protein ABH840_00030 [Nanoarchaeota archaeon]